jgi:cytochrome P450
MELLGVPRDDWDALLKLANETVGAGDPEYNRGEPSNAAAIAAREAMFEVFARHIAARRQEPRDDLMSVLVQAELDGRKLSDYEVLSYCFLLAAAGNETTRNATSGGVLALSERPGELTRMRREPRLLRTAADEIVRFVSPIIHFCRTATVDAELGGRQIRAGDTLVLFYPSAGRDESVFPNAEELDLARSPNPHVSFGIGEHYCLGASLAKLELECIFRELATRIETIELAGPIERLRATVIGGVKRMPVRITPVAARG